MHIIYYTERYINNSGNISMSNIETSCVIKSSVPEVHLNLTVSEISLRDQEQIINYM